MHEAWTDSENDEQLEGMTPDCDLRYLPEFETQADFYEWYNSLN
jgi:hypothetical protein